MNFGSNLPVSEETTQCGHCYRKETFTLLNRLKQEEGDGLYTGYICIGGDHRKGKKRYGRGERDVNLSLCKVLREYKYSQDM